jgi:hypothetical protein
MAQHYLSYALSVFGGIFMTCNVYARCVRSAHTHITGSLRVVLIKQNLVLPDDVPYCPKHVGVILMYCLC